MLSLANPLPVTVFGSHRDSWDWLLYIFALVAAVVALVTFLDWLSKLRARPEIGIRWETPDRQDWPPNQVAPLAFHRAVVGLHSEVSIIVRNVGTAMADKALINVTTPDFMTLRSQTDPSGWHETTNEIVGLPEQGKRVNFLAITRDLAPGTDLLIRLNVELPKEPAPSRDTYRIMAEVSHVRLNARGRKWIPTYVGRDLPPWTTRDKWPGRGLPVRDRLAVWKSWRFVCATPKERLRCDPGNRKDIREFIIKATQGGIS